MNKNNFSQYEKNWLLKRIEVLKAQKTVLLSMPKKHRGNKVDMINTKINGVKKWISEAGPIRQIIEKQGPIEIENSYSKTETKIQKHVFVKVDSIYPKVLITKYNVIGRSMLMLSTMYRKLYNGIYYKWHIAKEYILSETCQEAEAVINFCQDVYFIAVLGKIDIRGIRYANGESIFQEDENQESEEIRVKNIVQPLP